LAPGGPLTIAAETFVMPRALLSVKQVAECLHVSTREVIRMAEHRILPGTIVNGAWQFRSGEIWNWIEANLVTLPERRRKDPHPHVAGRLLIAPALQRHSIAVSLIAKTKKSVLRELVALARNTDASIDALTLIEALSEREAQGSTALQDGVAVPHPARPLHTAGPLLAAARTARPIPFGERGGGLTDLFFLICCPDQVEHLLYLGRLCRLLIDKKLQTRFREAHDADSVLDAIRSSEESLCGE
jgi:mannitol/fructose-specific phosphotransferase system IIA component (Ntr-type)